MNKFKTYKIVNALTNLLITLVIVVVAVSVSNNFKSTENELYYSDTNHLTIKGNQIILPEIIKIINK